MHYIWSGHNLAQETIVDLIFEIDISQNTKCDNSAGFPNTGHLFALALLYCENLQFYNLLTLAEPSLFQTSVADSFCLQQSADWGGVW